MKFLQYNPGFNSGDRKGSSGDVKLLSLWSLNVCIFFSLQTVYVIWKKQYSSAVTMDQLVLAKGRSGILDLQVLAV